MKVDMHFQQKDLWGKHKPEGFGEAMLLLTLHMDLTGASYADLLKIVCNHIILAKDSLKRNVHTCCKKLRCWAKTVVVPSPLKKLEKIAKDVDCPPLTTLVTLWANSTDFPTIHHKKSPDDKKCYSKKLGMSGRRWLTVCDADGRTQFISKPFKPTDYDSVIMVYHHIELEEAFPNVTMIADCHFSSAAEVISSFHIITPKSGAGRPRVIDGKKVPHQLPPEDIARNNVIAGVRGSVKAPFGWIDAVFGMLSVPFRESEEQHDCLVWYAMVVHCIQGVHEAP
jgi:hypothetical protein